MAKSISAAEQAERLFSRHMDKRGWSKIDQQKSLGYRSEMTLARRTADLGRLAASVFEREGISRIKDITPEMARNEIYVMREDGYASVTLAGYAKSMSDAHQLLHGSPIDYGSIVPPRSSDAPTAGRACSDAQIREIMAHQPNVFALMARMAYEAGLRPSELNSIRLARDFPAKIAKHREAKLVEHRFAGRSGVDFVVRGKGGLERVVRLSKETADKLEAFRLDAPREVRSIRGEDNRVITQYYDLPTGEQFSRNFSEVSKELFGKGQGAHSLRHSYCQQRMKELLNQGFTWDEALAAVSNETGHFRPSITQKHYLR